MSKILGNNLKFVGYDTANLGYDSASGANYNGYGGVDEGRKYPGINGDYSIGGGNNSSSEPYASGSTSASHPQYGYNNPNNPNGYPSYAGAQDTNGTTGDKII